MIQEGATQGRPALEEVCRQFLAYKRNQLDSGELSPRSWDEYRQACEHACACFGAGRRPDELGPLDFAELRQRLAARFGPRGLTKFIHMTRTLLSWAREARLMDRPADMGAMFQPPTRKVVRQAASGVGRRTFTAEQVRDLLEAASPRLRAFILLGINCGYGQNDIAALPASSVAEALETGRLSFPRPKTAIERDAVLWPETLEALRDTERCNGTGSLATPELPGAGASGGELAFTTRRGNPWVRSVVHHDAEGRIVKVVHVDAIATEFQKVRGAAGVPGPGFYGLRRTFRTVADEAGDPHAADRVMGHEIPGMRGVYVDWLAGGRIAAVCERVRRWIWSHPPCDRTEDGQYSLFPACALHE